MSTSGVIASAPYRSLKGVNLVAPDLEVLRLDNLQEFIYPLSFILIEEALFDASENDSIGSFDCPVEFGVIE